MLHPESIKRFLRFVLLFITLSVVIVLLMRAQTTTLTGPFELEAAEQWIVRQDRPGEIVTRHTLGRRKAIQEMRLYRFPDEDILKVSLMSNLTEGAWVEVNDPILDFQSLTDKANKKILEARIEKLKLQTNVFHGGELQARYKQSLAALALAQTNLNSFIPMVERRRNLVKSGVLSEDEFQITESEYFKRLQDVEVARAAALYRKSQAAPSVIAMSDAQLNETEQELQLVNDRLAAHLIRTPIKGRITRSSGDPAILLRVVNEEKLIARIVAPIDFKDKIQLGDKVVLNFKGFSNKTIESHVNDIIVQSVPMLGQSILHILVPIENTNRTYTIAMSGKAVLTSVKMNPLQIMISQIKSAFGKNSEKR